MRRPGGTVGSSSASATILTCPHTKFGSSSRVEPGRRNRMAWTVGRVESWYGVRRPRTSGLTIRPDSYSVR